MDEISEGEDDMMAGIIDGVLGSHLIFVLPVLLPVLDELCELSLDGAAKIVLLQLVLPLYMHGAKIIINATHPQMQ